jgi:hypothetical protein
MGEHTLYGRCVGCGRWVPRDEMLSINTNLYDAMNRKTVVRHRYCPGCFDRERQRAQSMMWDHIVVSGRDLAPMDDGSFPTNEVIWERRRMARQHPEADPSSGGAGDEQEART